MIFAILFWILVHAKELRADVADGSSSYCCTVVCVLDDSGKTLEHPLLFLLLLFYIIYIGFQTKTRELYGNICVVCMRTRNCPVHEVVFAINPFGIYTYYNVWRRSSRARVLFVPFYIWTMTWCERSHWNCAKSSRHAPSVSTKVSKILIK